MEREKPEKNKDPSSYIGLSAKKRKIAGSPERGRLFFWLFSLFFCFRHIYNSNVIILKKE